MRFRWGKDNQDVFERLYTRFRLRTRRKYDDALATNPETVYAAMAETVWEWDERKRE